MRYGPIIVPDASRGVRRDESTAVTSCRARRVRGEHRVDFLAQRAVAGARPIEIARPGRRVARQRRVEDLGDLPPAFRCHKSRITIHE